MTNKLFSKVGVLAELIADAVADGPAERKMDWGRL